MRHRFAVSAALLLPAICLAQKVTIDYDHNSNFSKYQTYRWVKIAENPAVNQLVDQRIIAAVDEQLSKKGLKRVESGGDLLVGYQGILSKQTQLTTFSDGMGPGWGWGPGWGGYGSSISTTTASSIPIGTLDIDMMDPAAKQLVFRGRATDSLSDKPEKNQQKINKAVAKIFDKYPPKPKK